MGGRWVVGWPAGVLATCSTSQAGAQPPPQASRPAHAASPHHYSCCDQLVCQRQQAPERERHGAAGDPALDGGSAVHHHHHLLLIPADRHAALQGGRQQRNGTGGIHSCYVILSMQGSCPAAQHNMPMANIPNPSTNQTSRPCPARRPSACLLYVELALRLQLRPRQPAQQQADQCGRCIDPGPKSII